MLNVSKADVAVEPYPHVVSNQMLDPDLYERLKKDFPKLADHQGGDSTGSRVGKGKGFDIYRGDQAYDELVRRSPAWAEFDAWINSPAFVHKFNELFGPYLEQLGINAQIDPSAYDRDLVEGRSELKEKLTRIERLKAKLAKAIPSASSDRPVLFTRLDVEKSTSGYDKPPHCDRGNRLCSLIIYFCDADERGLEGGELQIFRHKRERAIEKMPRHPAPEDVTEVARLKPRDNLGVFFPCSNNSYHGVTQIKSQGVERDFLYINISADEMSLWK